MGNLNTVQVAGVPYPCIEYSVNSTTPVEQVKGFLSGVFRPNVSSSDFSFTSYLDNPDQLSKLNNIISSGGQVGSLILQSMSINSLPAQPVTIAASFVDSAPATVNTDTVLANIALSDLTQSAGDWIASSGLRSFTYNVNLNYNVPQSNAGVKSYLLDYIEYTVEVGTYIGASTDFCDGTTADLGTIVFSNCVAENLGSISLDGFYQVGSSTNNSLSQPSPYTTTTLARYQSRPE